MFDPRQRRNCGLDILKLLDYPMTELMHRPRSDTSPPRNIPPLPLARLSKRQRLHHRPSAIFQLDRIKRNRPLCYQWRHWGYTYHHRQRFRDSHVRRVLCARAPSCSLCTCITDEAYYVQLSTAGHYGRGSEYKYTYSVRSCCFYIYVRLYAISRTRTRRNIKCSRTSRLPPPYIPRSLPRFLLILRL